MRGAFDSFDAEAPGTDGRNPPLGRIPLRSKEIYPLRDSAPRGSLSMVRGVCAVWACSTKPTVSRGALQVCNSVIKKPDLSDPKLRAKLAKGMGHNYYGEPAWPNDLLYIFPVCILGTIACVVGLSVLDPAVVGEPANPFATPLEILPEWCVHPSRITSSVRSSRP
jgi:hypothetical protein